MAILAVIFHHSSNLALTILAERGTRAHWWALQAFVRVVRFAVPAFILYSVLLVTMSLIREGAPNWRTYFGKRLKGTLYPYVIWSCIYLPLTLKQIGALAPGGAKLVTAKFIESVIFYGKAWTHLYFLSALLQVQILLPLMASLALGALAAAKVGTKRRMAASAWFWVVVGLALQVAVYIVSHQIGAYYWSRGSEPPLPPFSSMFYAYLLPTFVGLSLALVWPAWSAKASGRKRWIWLTLIPLFAVYLAVDMRMVLADVSPVVKARGSGKGVSPALPAADPSPLASIPLDSSLAEEGLFMAFSTLAGVVLLDLCAGWHGRIAGWFQTLGQESLGLFLVHPLVLLALRHGEASRLVRLLPVPEISIVAITLGVTYLILLALRALKLSTILFGRA